MHQLYAYWRSESPENEISGRMAALPLMLLLMFHGVYGQTGWYVKYGQFYICALKGSTVTMTCNYPTGYAISQVFWTTSESVKLPKYTQGYCNSGYQDICHSLRIGPVTQWNSDSYYCTLIYSSGGRWTQTPGMSLSVTDLQVESPEKVTEGDSVHLTCKTSCKLTDTPTFTWFRNLQPLTWNNEIKLTLNSVSRRDAGNYSCGVREHNYISPAIYLDVRYPPKSASVSIRESSRIMEGDLVTLSCSADSNPPAELTWYKDKTLVGSKGIYSISKISSDDSGEYKCRAINEHGQKYSNPVTLNVIYPPKSVSVSISRSGEIVSGDSVTLSCSSDSNPPAELSWYKDETLVGSEGIYSIYKISSGDSGEYKCRARNEHGEKPSETVSLNVMYPPRSVSVSISESGEIVSGDLVTLSCSSDSNPPAEFSWFKGKTFLGSGGILSISKISSGDSGEYKCRANNKYGENLSDAVRLNVMHPPGNPVISISPSAVLVSGDSVTLRCRTASNPPPEISWFKGATFIRSNDIYYISKISPDDSGEYKCRARNEHGEKDSDPVTLNIMYPPRNVSVSITDSVSLSCISDSNPPAEISWFKEDQSSAVGSGQRFSAVQSGRFYCEAHNPHGSQRSDAVTVTGHQSIGINGLSVTIAVSGGLFILIVIIIVILFLMKRINRRSDVHEYENDGPSANRYAALDLKSRSFDQYNTLATVHPKLAVHQLGFSEYENMSQQSNTPI